MADVVARRLEEVERGWHFLFRWDLHLFNGAHIAPVTTDDFVFSSCGLFVYLLLGWLAPLCSRLSVAVGPANLANHVISFVLFFFYRSCHPIFCSLFSFEHTLRCCSNSKPADGSFSILRQFPSYVLPFHSFFLRRLIELKVIFLTSTASVLLRIMWENAKRNREKSVFH